MQKLEEHELRIQAKAEEMINKAKDARLKMLQPEEAKAKRADERKRKAEEDKENRAAQKAAQAEIDQNKSNVADAGADQAADGNNGAGKGNGKRTGKQKDKPKDSFAPLVVAETPEAIHAELAMTLPVLATVDSQILKMFQTDGGCKHLANTKALKDNIDAVASRLQESLQILHKSVDVPTELRDKLKEISADTPHGWFIIESLTAAKKQLVAINSAMSMMYPQKTSDAPQVEPTNKLIAKLRELGITPPPHGCSL